VAIYPKAEVKLLSKKYSGFRRMAYYNRMNLHIAVSRAKSLFSFFNRSGRPSSHFYIRKSGVVEQYVDTAFQAEADLEGNDATISVETEGGVFKPNSRKWTAAQMEALAALYAWAHKTHGLPLRLATNSKIGASSKGLSWHRLGIDGNFPSTGMLAGRLQRGGGMHYSTSRGKVCPGDAKILQIPAVLSRAAEIAGGAAVVTSPVKPAPHPKPKLAGGFNMATLPTVLIKRSSNHSERIETIQALMQARGYYRAWKIDGLAGDGTLGEFDKFQRATGSGSGTGGKTPDRSCGPESWKNLLDA